MKKQLKILTAFAFLALSNLCGAGTEFDIETGLNGKRNSLPIAQEEQKLNEQPSVLLRDSDDVEYITDVEMGERSIEPSQNKKIWEYQPSTHGLFTRLTNKIKLTDFTFVAVHFAFLVAVNVTSDLFSLGLNYLLKKN